MLKKIISILLSIVIVFPAFSTYANAMEIDSDFVDGGKLIPSDAVYYSGHYYKIYNLGGTWEKAKLYCESLGGHLATITSDKENTFLYNYMKSKGYSSCYFGLKRDSKEINKWRWVTGEPFNYNKWSKGEPSNGWGVEYYGMFYIKSSQYSWNDGGKTTDGDYGASSNSCTFMCEWDSLKFNNGVFMSKQDYIKSHLDFIETNQYNFMKIDDTYKESLRYALILGNGYDGLKTTASNLWKYMSLDLFKNEYEILLTDFMINRDIYDKFESKFDKYSLKNERKGLFDLMTIIESGWDDPEINFDYQKTIDLILGNISTEGNESYVGKLCDFLKNNESKIKGIYKDASECNMKISLAADSIKETKNFIEAASAIEAYKQTSDEFKQVLADVKNEIDQSDYDSKGEKLSEAIDEFLKTEEEEGFYQELIENAIEGTRNVGFKALWNKPVKAFFKAVLIKSGVKEAVAISKADAIVAAYDVGMLINDLITNNDEVTNNILLIEANTVFEKYTLKVLEKYENNLQDNPTFKNASLFDECYSLYNRIEVYALDKYVDNLEKSQSDLVHIIINWGSHGNEEEIQEVNNYKNELESIMCHNKDAVIYEELEKANQENPYYDISMNKDYGTLDQVGDKQELKIISSDDNGTYNQIIWESKDPSIATVDQNGVVTAVKDGFTTISATVKTDYGDKIAIFNVKVDTGIKITAISEDESKGEVRQSTTEYIKEGNSITLKAYPNEGYYFKGWYLDGELVSKSLQYTFNASKYDCEYIAKFADKLYEYEDTNGGICITSYNGTDKEVVIPTEIEGKKVVSMAEKLFFGNTTIQSVQVPDSVKNIEENTFLGCEDLIIYGVAGSTIDSYANRKNLSFISLEEKASFSVKNNETLIEGKQVTLLVDKLGTNYQYKFLEKSGSNWRVIKNYSDQNEASYIPTSGGTKTLYVDVKNTDTNVITRKSLIIKVSYPELQVESFTASPEDKQIVGEDVELSAQGNGGSGSYQYKFLEKDSKGSWTKIRDYESENTATYIPTSVGKKTLYVDIKDTKTGQVIRKSLIYNVEYSDVEVECLGVSPEKYQVLGEEIELTANVIGGSGNFEYKFLEKDSQGNWIKIRDYEKTNTTKYTPQSIGKTTLYVDVKDLDTKKVVRKYVIFVICESKFEVTSFKVDKESPYTVNDEITLTAKATGGSEKYQYKFLVKEGNKWTVIQNYSDKDTCKYVPATTGSKTLYVDVKDTVTGVVIRKYLLVKAV